MYDLRAESVPPIGVLIAIQTPDMDDVALSRSLEELGKLAKTFGIEVVSHLTQRRAQPENTTFLGPGKVDTLAEQLEALRVARPGRPIAIIADHELTPHQHRALADRAGADDVLDRTGLILEIFHRHAQSREARAQVELARLAYLAPRLRALQKGADVGRVRGGVGGKGAGESGLELSRRQLRDRESELRRELEQIERERQVQRARRELVRCVALVGYTNAGKSTLMRALTGSNVLVEDKLFATLDSTVRLLAPPVEPSILVSDTVGFIRKLPHRLVASFKTTLEAALEARLLLHIVDLSDDAWRDHIATTHEVLAEIGAGDIPTRLVFNKRDRITDPARLDEAREEFPDALVLSACAPSDVAVMHAEIVAVFQGEREEHSIRLRHDQGALRSRLFELSEVLDERYDEDGGVYRVMISPEALQQLEGSETSLSVNEPSA